MAQGLSSQHLVALDLSKVSMYLQYTSWMHLVCLQWVESAKRSSDVRTLDVFVLLLFHSMQFSKVVEKIVRNKVHSGVITSALVEASLTQRHAPVRHCLPENL